MGLCISRKYDHWRLKSHAKSQEEHEKKKESSFSEDYFNETLCNVKIFWKEVKMHP